MNKFLVSILLAMSGGLAFAAGELGDVKAYDKYTGIYRSSDKQFTVLVSKVLVKEGDLLNEPEYEYQVKVTDRENSFAEGEFSLTPNEAGELSGDTIDTECDDPGCYDVDYTIDIGEENGVPTFNLNVEWYRYPDGDEDEDSGSFERKAIRAFSGVESPLAREERLASDTIRDIVYQAVSYQIRWISSNGDYRIAATAEESTFNVYKKIFTADKQLEGLFVSTKTKYQNRDGRVGATECLTLLVKKTNWKAVYSDCAVGPDRF